MAYLLRHALELLLLAVAIWLPGFALDAGVVRLPPSPLRGVARWLLGVAYWEVWLFALAALGWLGRPGTAIAFGVALFASALVGWMRRGAAAARPAGERRFWNAGSLLGLGPALLLAIVFAGALAPSLGWDAEVYHLTIPKLYLAHGGFRPIEMNIWSNGPLAVEMLFGLALTWFDYPLTGAVHWGSGLLLVYTLLAGVRRSGLGVAMPRGSLPSAGTAEIDRASGWLAAALLLANGVVLWVLRVAYVDAASAWLLLGAFLLAEHAARESDDGRRYLLVAGLAAGLHAGTKINGIVGVAVLATVLLWGQRSGSGPRLGWWRWLGWFGLPALALWVPWLLKSLAATGNPVYPLLYDWFGGPDWSAQLQAQTTRFLRLIGMGRGVTDYLLLPWRLAVESDWGYARFDGPLGWQWLLAVPLALVAAWRRAEVRRPLAVAGLLFASWAAGTQQSRLLIPCLALVALACGRAVAPWAEPWSRHRAWRPALVAAGLGLALVLWQAEERNLHSSLAAFSSYRQPGFDPARAGAYPEVFDFVRTALPPRAKILFLNTNLGFFCDREYLADSLFEASQIADWLRPATDTADLVRRLRQRGITHVLYRKHDWGIAYPPALRALLRDDRSLRWIHDDPGLLFRLGELRLGGPEPQPPAANPR